MEDALAIPEQQQGEDAEDIVQMVGFIIDNELFGVNILMVQEIIKDLEITAIPDAPDFVVGVINLRGNIIPILDLHERLKLSVDRARRSEKSWILILNVGGRVTGFLVDQVTRVIKVQANMIKPPPELVVQGLDSDYIRGVCKQDQQLLTILDFNRILLVDEFKKISALKAKRIGR
ncbi:MAG: chemotaxis protein CheW [Desulfobacteraceae bacterium]|jgi:purine-binding chemotaxis protein CheW